MSYPAFGNEFGDWESNAHFTLVSKTIVDFELAESGDSIEFDGILQPLKSQQVNQKPEGQRIWRWWSLITEQELKMDDVVNFNHIDYRVFAKEDFSDITGRYVYELAEAFHTI
jgi:hypothetical protein